MEIDPDAAIFSARLNDGFQRIQILFAAGKSLQNILRRRHRGSAVIIEIERDGIVAASDCDGILEAQERIGFGVACIGKILDLAFFDTCVSENGTGHQNQG